MYCLLDKATEPGAIVAGHRTVVQPSFDHAVMNPGAVLRRSSTASVSSWLVPPML